MSSFLQTTDWLEFQKSLGREGFEYDKEGISAKVIKHNLPLGKSYLYIPHGPEVDFNSMTGGEKNPVRNFIGWLKDLAKKEKSIFVKIEPMDDHVAQSFADPSGCRGFKKSNKNIQPQRTVVLNLESSMEEILERMNFKARRNVKISLQQQTEFIEENNAEEFWKLLKKTTGRNKFSSHPKEYYQKLISFFGNGRDISVKTFFVKSGDRPLAAAIVLFFGGTAYYIHGASDHNEQQLRSPYKLQWEIIKYLKTRGIKYYDLWGIDAKKWPGVTRFKISWLGETKAIPNGHIVERPGSFDLPVSKIWYLLYKIFRKK